MKERDAFRWAEMIGRDLATSEAEAIATAKAIAAQKELEQQIAARRKESFDRALASFIPELSSQVQFAVNALNHGYGAAAAADAPAPLGAGNGFILAKRTFAANADAPGLGFPSEVYRTRVEVDFESGVLTVFHIYRDRDRVVDLSAKQEQKFLLKLDDGGAIAVQCLDLASGKQTESVTMHDLVQLICTPLFTFEVHGK